MALTDHNIIFKAIVGSQAYGTNMPTSDVDHKGIYIQDNNDILSMRYVEQYDVTKDECYWEIWRFIELLSKANPTVLELLYSPEDCIVTTSPQYELLKKVRPNFLTKECRNSFGGYAMAQIQKAKGLNKKMNWERARIERKEPMDFCYVPIEGGSLPLKEWLADRKQENCGLTAINHMVDYYHLYYDMSGVQKFKGIQGENSNELRLSSIPKGWHPVTQVYYNKSEYSRHCREFNEYQEWLNNRNIARYVDVENHGQQIDGKNLMHCRRLLDMAIEIAKTGTLVVRRPNAEYLKSIRLGKVSLEQIIAQAEEDIYLLDGLYESSTLPETVQKGFSNDLLLELRTM